MKNYYKNKESLYLKYWDVNSPCGWARLQKLPVDGFKWVEGLSKFEEFFKKIYDEKIKKDISLTLIFNILKIYLRLKTIYDIYSK